jgi:hypothetical protein
VWLLRVPAGDTPADGEYRLCTGRGPRRAGGLSWVAGMIGVSLPEEVSEASTGEARVRVVNASGLAMAAVDRGGALLGRRATLYLVHESGLADFALGLRWEYRVLAVEASGAEAVLVLGHPADLDRVPSRVFTRAEFPQLRGGRA